MSTQLQLRRGNSATSASFTGAEGEVTVNTTDKAVVVHDGVTAGGFEAARTDLVNVQNATFYAKGIEAGLGGGGGGGGLSAAIDDVTQANPGVVTTVTDHEFTSGMIVTFTDVGGMTELNGNSYYANVLTGNTFALYSDIGLTTTLNTTGFTAFTSGGNVAASVPPGAPATASYVVITANPTLTSERVLTSGAGIVLSDGGAGGGATLSANLSSTVPSNLGSAAAGVANTISRSDHVHAMPTAADVGAVPVTRNVIAGNGLSGGGALSANVTLNLSANANALGDVTYVSSPVNGDVLVYNGATSQWENTQNLPRMTIQDRTSNVGTPNAVKTLNFAGAALAGSQVTITANADPTIVNVNIPTIFTEENVEDIVGNMITNGTGTGIVVQYDDPNDRINFTANTFTITLNGDVTGTATVSSLANTTMTTTINVGAVALGTDTTGNYVATLAAGAANIITLNNTSGVTNGAAWTVSFNTSAANYIESVQDISAEMLALNTGNRGIISTYNDETGRIELAARTYTITLEGDLSGTATVANLGNITLNAQYAADSVVLGQDTTGNYVQQVTVSGSGLSATGTGEGANVAITLNSANTNTANAVVVRDGNGSFSANVITASLTGLASLNLPLTGGTLTGNLILAGAPTANLQAATKLYVDQAVAGAGGAVTKIIAGTNVTISPVGGTGEVTINATGGAAGVSSLNGATGAVSLSGVEEEITVSAPSAGVITLGVPNTFSTVNVTGTTGVTGGNVVASQATAATNTSTGALRSSGGLGVAGNAFIGGLLSVSGNANVANIGAVNAVFTNISGIANLSASGTISAATGNFTALTGISSLTVGGSLTVNNILNGNGANGVGNIGNASSVFNTVFAKATSAQYADLAEKYTTDADYTPGTVVVFGGEAEVTICDEVEDHRVAGVVSENPSYIMNAGLEAEHVAIVALTGRVPCRVLGPVRKGDLLVSAGTGAARTKNDARAGTIIGKSLEDFHDEYGVIEIVVGRS